MKLIILLFSSIGLFAQAITTSSITLTAPPPPSVKSLSTSLVGNPGNATYYYWVVANYTGGKSVVSPSAVVINAPNVLSISNYVRINWNAQAGANTYDVLRTTTANIPNGNCNCAVTTATSATTASDQGSALSAYTVSSAGGASTTCIIDNLTVASPEVSCDPIAWGGGSSGGATNLSGLTDLQVTRTSATVLNIAAGNGKVGSSTSIFAAATGTLSGASASGNVYAYVTSGGVLTLGHNSAWTLTCSGCTTTTGVSAFPVDSIPLAVWTVTNSTFDSNGGTDYRAINVVDRPITSSTLTITTTATGRTIEYTSPIVASGTATLGTSAISANTCASVVTVAATGTITTNTIAASFNADVSGVTGYGAGASDGLFIISYPSVNNVNFKVCNPTGSSITPGAATLNWRVL